MPTATFIKQMDGWSGDARMYRMDPPWQDEEYVIASATNVMGRPETYLFPASLEGGNPTSWTDMDGSQKDTLQHAQVLADIGYVVTEEDQ